MRCLTKLEISTLTQRGPSENPTAGMQKLERKDNASGVEQRLLQIACDWIGSSCETIQTHDWLGLIHIHAPASDSRVQVHRVHPAVRRRLPILSGRRRISSTAISAVRDSRLIEWSGINVNDWCNRSRDARPEMTAQT